MPYSLNSEDLDTCNVYKEQICNLCGSGSPACSQAAVRYTDCNPDRCNLAHCEVSLKNIQNFKEPLKSDIFCSLEAGKFRYSLRGEETTAYNEKQLNTIYQCLLRTHNSLDAALGSFIDYEIKYRNPQVRMQPLHKKIITTGRHLVDQGYRKLYDSQEQLYSYNLNMSLRLCRRAEDYATAIKRTVKH